jgi:HPt (histidine-containing phosphotransfer) domain-containing protein
LASKIHIDRELALMRVGGDEELLREVAALFLENETLMMDAIRGALLAGDAASVELNAHSLKGSISNFGADDAVAIALSIESLGRERALNGAWQKFDQLEKAMHELRPELERLAGPS